ncbi:hypothetical protein AC579_9612 [Pseudocercospora musae]|uniref:Uncharacterized protein n=1 Tax=Pseudocercospora musae TaxID=113226 RepID=A0A139ITN9_9PEZI|nr:hypothetical protein AC579_9612 [Pseudocercospora musae]
MTLLGDIENRSLHSSCENYVIGIEIPAFAKRTNAPSHSIVILDLLVFELGEVCTVGNVSGWAVAISRSTTPTKLETALGSFISAKTRALLCGSEKRAQCKFFAGQTKERKRNLFTKKVFWLVHGVADGRHRNHHFLNLIGIFYDGDPAGLNHQGAAPTISRLVTNDGKAQAASSMRVVNTQ